MKFSSKTLYHLSSTMIDPSPSRVISSNGAVDLKALRNRLMRICHELEMARLLKAIPFTSAGSRSETKTQHIGNHHNVSSSQWRWPQLMVDYVMMLAQINLIEISKWKMGSISCRCDETNELFMANVWAAEMSTGKWASLLIDVRWERKTIKQNLSKAIENSKIIDFTTTILFQMVRSVELWPIESIYLNRFAASNTTFRNRIRIHSFEFAHGSIGNYRWFQPKMHIETADRLLEM